MLELGNPAHPQHAQHLERLAQQYWKPVYHFLRTIRRGAVEDVEDLTQQFFAMLISRDDFAKLSPERGSFRGFLKTALRRLSTSADRHDGARRPHDGARLLRFEEAEASWKESGGTPEEAFDREWAREVMTASLARLREELRAEGKERHYEIFHQYSLEPDEAVSYEELAKRHGMSLDDVRNTLRTVRQRGREVLKEMLRDYLFPGEDVESELRFILER